MRTLPLQLVCVLVAGSVAVADGVTLGQCFRLGMGE